MASYFTIFSLPDHHIDYLKQNEDEIFEYMDGELVCRKTTQKLKRLIFKALNLTHKNIDFPTQPVETFNPDINHKSVPAFHFILNGTTDFILGAGTIFQTWLSTDTHSAINMDNMNENFAFKSEMIPDLLKIVNQLTDSKIKSRYCEWFSVNYPEHTPCDIELSELCADFVTFRNGLKHAVQNKLGIMWVAC